jgi:hypothetical protein
MATSHLYTLFLKFYQSFYLINSRVIYFLIVNLSVKFISIAAYVNTELTLFFIKLL